jgi:hypothetical protein
MKRSILAAAAAAAPLILASAPVLAQVTISGSQSTPVKTSTANNGQPSDVTVSGSIGLTSPGVALTLDSNNTVDVTGTLGATDQNDTVGLEIVGGNTGSATITGTIDITESYKPPNDPNNNGLQTGAFAQGSDRIGIEVTGASPFVGSITDTGSVTVMGNDSEGVSIQAPITGDFMMLTVTPASGSTAASVKNGTITVTGQNDVGFQITPTGGVGGNIRLTSISATGPGAQAVELNGGVGGYVNISGAEYATGYRTLSRQSNPFLSELYSQMELQQGGAAVTVGGNLGGGLIVSAPPPALSTTNLDQDADGVPDAQQGTGSVISYGSAPAMQVGAVNSASLGTPGATITVSAFTGSHYLSPYNSNSAFPPGQFGLVNQGTIVGEGVFDQLTSPFLLSPVSATALQIGGQILVTPELFTFGSNNQPTSNTPTPAVYGTSGQVNVVGGVYNSGTIEAAAYQANATAIHLGSGANVPTIYNDGSIFAQSTQVNSSLTATPNAKINGIVIPTTPAPVAVDVYGILIDAGANISTITNNSGILAQLTGSGGVGGFTGAIVDKSGKLQNINNTGSIAAVLNSTVVSAPLPTSEPGHPSNTVAIDMSAGTLDQTVTQALSPLNNVATVTAYSAANSYKVGAVVSYQGNFYVNVVAANPGIDPVDDPSNWRQIGSVTPSIVGDIYMGSGNDTLNIQAGNVNSGSIAMGAGVNTIKVLGASTTFEATVAGNITEQAGGSFVIEVNNGVLADLNPKLNQAATSIAIGPTGVLRVTVDPLNNQNTQFIVSGGTNIATGGQIGLEMASLQTQAVQNYTVIEGPNGSIIAPSLGAAAIGNTPFLYTASAALAPGSTTANGKDEINLTVTRKSAAQLGFNAAEASAFDAVLHSLEAPTADSVGIQQALLAQTDQAGLKSVYDQLLPNQAQGIFQALDAAVEKVSALTATPPDNATHVGGTSLWLQEVNERVERSGIDTLGSSSQLLGLVGGYERMGAAGGALGVTVGYFNVSENSTAAQLGARDVASLIEASVYYRRSFGNLTFSMRGGGGYGWFSQDRIFAYAHTLDEAKAGWTGDFIDAHVGLAYEIKLFGPYYARPEVSVDYLGLHQNGYQEMGTATAFNLKVGPQSDTQFSSQGLIVLGRQWGRESWFRAEVRAGYREVITGQVGEIDANFLNGTPFVVAGDPDKGGWMTFGFSLKSGSQSSYLALEGDADIRKGQKRYDLRVAGKSVF